MNYLNQASNCMATQNSIDLNRRNCLGVFTFIFLVSHLTPLHLAVQTNNVELIRTFVSLEKTDLNCRDDQGNSPLHIAVKLNNLEIVKILCSSHRIDKNIRDNNVFLFLVCYKWNSIFF